MKDVAAAIQMARLRLIIDEPFFGSLIFGMKTVERIDIPTFATDGENLYYSPKFADKLNNQEMLTVLCHEILHCAQGHIFRRGARDPERWNIAADFAVNQIIEDCNAHARKEGGIEPFAFSGVLKNCCLPQKAFLGLSAEEIYNRLPPTPPGGGRGKGFGEVMDSPCQDKADQIQKQEEWKVKVIQAATAAKSHGSLPDSLKRMIDELVNPNVPWREQLRHFFNIRVREDYSWRRANNRFIHRGLYLPTLDGIQMGEIVVAIDTSGSIGAETLALFQSEMQSIMDECVPKKMTVIYCDAKVNEVVEYHPGDLLQLEAHGGGGTDFRPVFKHVADEYLEPVCLVYLTDLMGTFPDIESDYPTMWASIIKDAKAPWGETIYIDE